VTGVAIFGITGRMGQTLVRALRDAPTLRLTGAVASPHSGRQGADAASEGAATGVMVTADPRSALAGAAVAVDFSLPQCIAANAHACVEARVPMVVGATGFDAATRTTLEAAAAVIPILIAPNTSVGVSLVAQLVRRATLALGPGYDVDISEAHHRGKRDAPSGTALALGEVVAGARGRRLADVAVFERLGRGPRGEEEIGFAVLRAGDTVGEHTVSFAAAGERVEITHRATDRVVFAHGALRAAEWLAGRPAGLYTMGHVLGLDQP
jgi:4-hydroxy-tetrahydrodipicolinate reductase